MPGLCRRGAARRHRARGGAARRSGRARGRDGLKAKDDEITPLRNERDDLATKLNGYCTRARSGIKGYFGDNSTEYELAGGTRASERKKGGPKGKTPEDPKPDA